MPGPKHLVSCSGVPNPMSAGARSHRRAGAASPRMFRSRGSHEDLPGAGHGPPGHVQARPGQVANNLAADLGDLGRAEEGLAASQEATGIYRELATARPDKFRPDLATS
jgi:hypothetical protein